MCVRERQTWSHQRALSAFYRNSPSHTHPPIRSHSTGGVCGLLCAAAVTWYSLSECAVNLRRASERQSLKRTDQTENRSLICLCVTKHQNNRGNRQSRWLRKGWFCVTPHDCVVQTMRERPNYYHCTKSCSHSNGWQAWLHVNRTSHCSSFVFVFRLFRLALKKLPKTQLSRLSPWYKSHTLLEIISIPCCIFCLSPAKHLTTWSGFSMTHQWRFMLSSRAQKILA